MTAPIRRIIDEEISVLIQALYKGGWDKLANFLESTTYLREFAEALEHSIDKYYLKEVKEFQSLIDREIEHYKNELIKELTEIKIAYLENMEQLRAKNKRLNDEIKRLQKKVRKSEKKPLTAHLNAPVSDPLTNELVKHLKDEITFLRTLLLRR